jgi:hypothetical protein
VTWVGYALAANTGNIKLMHFQSTGDAAVGWSPNAVSVTTAPIDRHHPRILPLADGVLVSWSESDDAGQGAVVASASAISGALPQLVEVKPWPDMVQLSWTLSTPPAYSVVPERRGDDGVWLPLKPLEREGSGRLMLSDREVTPGERLSYRLRLRTPALDALMPEISVAVPAPTPLAIRGIHAEAGQLHLFYSIPGQGETRFELFDVQGRRLMRESLRSDHTGDLDKAWPVPAGLRSGIYFARLVQARASRTRRFVLSK